MDGWMRNGLCAALITVSALGAKPASAQARPKPVGELAVGTLLFADDSVVTEGFVGGAARFYLTPRISVGPEVALIEGNNHSHQMLTGNATVDLIRPLGGEPRAVTPFVVVGAGHIRTVQQFPNNETFTSSEGAFTAGGGVRALVGRGLFLGAEARVGWELHIRLNAIVGVRFGR
jgi:Outer membrane protein beta-barrel domain